MQIQELHYDFEIKIDKVDSLQHQEFLPAEIDWILNEGIKIIVKQRFGENNSKKVGFETDQKRIQDLKTLHINSPSSTQPGIVPTQISPGIYEARLSQLNYNLWFLTRATALITKTGCGSRIAKASETQHDDLSDVLLTDSFWKPSFEWSDVPITFGRSDIVQDDKGSMYLYTNQEFTIDQVYINYIKMPNRVCIGGYIDINGDLTTPIQCDLPELLHSEIVDVAVSEAARIISDPNFLQIKQQKLTIHE